MVHRVLSYACFAFVINQTCKQSIAVCVDGNLMSKALNLHLYAEHIMFVYMFVFISYVVQINDNKIKDNLLL